MNHSSLSSIRCYCITTGIVLVAVFSAFFQNNSAEAVSHPAVKHKFSPTSARTKWKTLKGNVTLLQGLKSAPKETTAFGDFDHVSGNKDDAAYVSESIESLVKENREILTFLSADGRTLRDATKQKLSSEYADLYKSRYSYTKDYDSESKQFLLTTVEHELDQMDRKLNLIDRFPIKYDWVNIKREALMDHYISLLDKLNKDGASIIGNGFNKEQEARIKTLKEEVEKIENPWPEFDSTGKVILETPRYDSLIRELHGLWTRKSQSP